MRIGVISDTHIPDRVTQIPKVILDDFKKTDLILHAGDLICCKVLEQLKSACKDVRAVWGNMDLPEVREALPEKLIIDAEGVRIGLIHGYGPPARLQEYARNAFKNESLQVIVFGHAHRPLNEKKDDVLYFNPGSPTDKIFSPYNSYGILEIADKQITANIIKI